MSTTVTTSGPLFDGSFAPTLASISNEIADVLGKEGKRRTLANLDASLRKPSGFYTSQVTLYGAVAGQSRIHDKQTIYGPWLEGIGSRNATTRFKGYASFRRAYQTLDAAAPHVAAEVIKRRLHELGG